MQTVVGHGLVLSGIPRAIHSHRHFTFNYIPTRCILTIYAIAIYSNVRIEVRVLHKTCQVNTGSQNLIASGRSLIRFRLAVQCISRLISNLTCLSQHLVECLPVVVNHVSSQRIIIKQSVTCIIDSTFGFHTQLLCGIGSLCQTISQSIRA